MTGYLVFDYRLINGPILYSTYLYIWVKKYFSKGSSFKRRKTERERERERERRKQRKIMKDWIKVSLLKMKTFLLY